MKQTQTGPVVTAGRGRPAWWLLVALASVILDQVSKWLVCAFLKGHDSVVLIPGILRMTYVENRGAAFGSFANHRWVFMTLSVVAIVAVTAYLLLLSENHRGSRLALALIIGGGVGNMIDRIALGYVVDFIDFCAFPRIWTWVFNVADCCVCVGVGLFLLFYIISSVRALRGKEADPRTGKLSASDGVTGHEESAGKGEAVHPSEHEVVAAPRPTAPVAGGKEREEEKEDGGSSSSGNPI